MTNIFKKKDDKRKLSGLPKDQAMVWSLIAAVFGYVIIRHLSGYENWVNYNSFFLVWLIFMKMLHNPLLDAPKELYDFKVEQKEFIDDDELAAYIKKTGSDGWDIVAIKPMPEVYMTFKLMFRKKYLEEK